MVDAVLAMRSEPTAVAMPVTATVRLGTDKYPLPGISRGRFHRNVGIALSPIIGITIRERLTPERHRFNRRVASRCCSHGCNWHGVSCPKISDRHQHTDGNGSKLNHLGSPSGKDNCHAVNHYKLATAKQARIASILEVQTASALPPKRRQQR
jgi:hypothetical protein